MQDGKIIPQARIDEIEAMIIETHRLMEEGRQVFKHIIKTSTKSPEAAQWDAEQASNNILGGKKTQVWDTLCENRYAISLAVTLPPALTVDEMKRNEVRLKNVIGQYSKHLCSMMVDIWTSRYEIGKLCQTTCYCRWPYHYGQQVGSLMAYLNEIIVDKTHHLKAEFCFEGKTKRWKNIKESEISQWTLQVGGVELPKMTQEELKEIHASKNGTFEDKLKAHKTTLLASQELFKPESLAQDVQQYLWAQEVAHLQQCKTFHLACELQSHNNREQSEAMFRFMGLVNGAAQAGSRAAKTVWCVSAQHPFHLGDDVRKCSLWMEYSIGDKFLTLDAPFFINMGECPGLKREDPKLGIRVAYCFKYSHGGEHGIQIYQSGLIFWQHVSEQVHLAHLAGLASILAKKMAVIGTKCAMMRDELRGNSGSSADAPQALENQ